MSGIRHDSGRALQGAEVDLQDPATGTTVDWTWVVVRLSYCMHGFLLRSTQCICPVCTDEVSCYQRICSKSAQGAQCYAVLTQAQMNIAAAQRTALVQLHSQTTAELGMLTQTRAQSAQTVKVAHSLRLYWDLFSTAPPSLHAFLSHFAK